ncbi:MAG: copper resistance system multicopper oxidase [Pseudomonadota bacterium]|nr:copper resistance system multicopper oxidase [Pseudomonadota bacterium]
MKRNACHGFELSRRRFVQGLSITAGAISLGVPPPRLFAADVGHIAPNTPEVLSGTEFDLTIDSTPMAFAGRIRPTTSVNGSVPAPTLRWREGTTVTLRVHNRLTTTSSIHWHGILLPFQLDGVPGISFPGIAPGETFTARFPVKQSGTYWYHSHSRFQEQTGLYGAIIIDPAEVDLIQADRDHVVLLSDWTDQDPEHVYATLKRRSDYYNYQLPDSRQFIHDARSGGLSAALSKRRMWNQMRMNPTDLGDVSGATYTYLANGASPAANWTAIAKAGERVRLRLINGSSSTFFDVRIPELKMTVVSADGQQVEPVTVEEIRMGAAETYDVIVEPTDDRAHTIFAQSMDRSGYARATLAPRPGMQAEVPALDPKSWLTMTDMGMGTMDMNMGMSHGLAMSDMPNMPMEHGAMGNMHGMSMPATPSMSMKDMKSRDPAIDMRVMSPQRDLNDPGPRLRGNGRRVLTYADLHTVGGAIDKRAATREIQLHLTGNMQRFIWGFDGKKFSEAGPLHFDHGERLRIVLSNDTMMAHPIHLHGMFGELEAANGDVLVRKHTFVVQPGKQLSYLVTADNVGQWAYHCHLLYHMEAGMFREVVVA